VLLFSPFKKYHNSNFKVQLIVKPGNDDDRDDVNYSADSDYDDDDDNDETFYF